MRKLMMLAVIASLSCCRTAPESPEVSPPIPEPPRYPPIEFRWDEDAERLWTTLPEGKALAKYRAEVEAYVEKVEKILEQVEVKSAEVPEQEDDSRRDPL